MTVFNAILALCLFGVVLYLIARFAPNPLVKSIGLGLVLLALVWWLLNVLGLLGPIVGARI